MTKLWCKLWNFLLNIFTTVVEAVGYALKTVGTVLVETAGAIAEAVGDVLGIPGNLFLWIAGGIGLYFLVKSSDDKQELRIEQVKAAAQGG